MKMRENFKKTRENHVKTISLGEGLRSGKSKKSYWQAFSYAGDSIHEAFFHLGSVPLESTVADALE